MRKDSMLMATWSLNSGRGGGGGGKKKTKKIFERGKGGKKNGVGGK
jgi:hypothetical protein